MKTNLRRIITWSLVCLLALFTVPAVSFADAPMTLEIYGGWSGDDVAIVQQIVDEFTALHPGVEVNLTLLQWTPLFAKLFTEVAAGNTVDVLAIQNMQLAQLADNGIIDPMPEGVTSVQLEKDFNPAAWESALYKGQVYGIPIDSSPQGVFYNADAFAKAGIEAFPVTGEEFIAAARKLTIDANGKNSTQEGFDKNNIVQYGLSLPSNHHGFYLWYTLMLQQGERDDLFTEGYSQVSINEEKSNQAWQWIQDLIYKYGVVAQNEMSHFDNFMSQNSAMVVQPSWGLATVAKVNPAFTVKTAPMPKVFDQQGAWTCTEMLTLPVSRDEARRAMAIEFVNFFADSEVFMTSGQMPAKLALQQKALETRPLLEAFLSEIPYMQACQTVVYATQIFTSVAPSPILSAAQNAILNQMPPEEVTRQLIEDINLVLDQ